MQSGCGLRITIFYGAITIIDTSDIGCHLRLWPSMDSGMFLHEWYMYMIVSVNSIGRKYGITL